VRPEAGGATGSLTPGSGGELPGPPEAARVRRSLRWSVADGASFFVMMGAAEAYFQAFAVFLKGTVFQVGLVSTLPIAVASLLLLASGPLGSLFGSRKRFNVAAGLLRTALFVPLALTPRMGLARVWLLLGMVCLYFLLNYLPNPAWTAWMRDLVGEAGRGAYFGRRNAIANLAGLAATVLAGLFLQLFTARPLYGFLLLFNLAFLGSAGSTLFLSLQHDPGVGRAEPKRLGLAAFLRELPRSNYGRFAAFNLLLYFGTFLSSPFVVPYMLRELRLDWFQFMVATALVSLSKFVALPLWGRLGDGYGSRRILVLSTALVCTTPFTWFLARSFGAACLVQAWGAFAWAGFEIAALSFGFDTMPPALVHEYTTYLLLFRGAGTLAGGLVGGALLPLIAVARSPYLGSFLTSGLFRLLAVFPLVFLMREVRAVPHISYPALVVKLLSMAPRALLRRWFPGRPG
jgi:MFS family permease